MKRIQLSKKNNVTFCCSCICRKKECLYKLSDDDNFDSLFETSDEKDYSFISMRKIKRHNSQACNFRIKFNLDKNRLCFNLVKSKNLVHNHKPEIIENEVRFIFNYNF